MSRQSIALSLLATLPLAACATQLEQGASPARAASSARKPAGRCADPMSQAIAVSSRLLTSISTKEISGLHHAEVIAAVYRHDRAHLRFVTLKGLEATGRRLRAHLATLRDHGLDAQRLTRARMAALIEELKRTNTRAPSDCAALIHIAAQLELFFADSLLRYAHDQNRRYLKSAQLRAKWNSSALPPRERHVDQRLARDLRSVRDLPSLERLLAQLEPPHPQYGRLVRAHARYRAIVAKGGWPRVEGVEGMVPGQRHRHVAALKARLAAEGYFDGLVNSRFDGALQRAIRRYQAAHQLEPSGIPDRALLRSVNVSALRRLTSIALTLQRWRESGVGASDYYVLVNVPDFHVEVWKRGERLLRRKVVVGRKNKTTCDERTHRRILAHATPLLSARLERVVFSPFWNVPRDIKEKELDPEAGKDPLFYHKKGYELLQAGTANERVRELPGPGNALGFVKFLFPNPHHVYLHDTPQKRLFNRPVRAFSHGCARVQDPFALARVLLREDGRWDERRFQRLRRRWRALGRRSRGGKTLLREVSLEQPVPIHIEYYAVRVDRRGAVHFLSDIYGLDRQRLDPRVARRCTPESVLARRRFASLERRVDVLEQKAGALDSCDGAPKKLTRFKEQFEHLARRTRQQHAAVAAQLEESRRGWTYKLSRRAVRAERLYGALSRLTRRAQRRCRSRTSLAAKANSRPSSS